ncbi:MAG: hypothetical protein CMH57_10995 [Myxococcales bacterium]|nr:hypothetical protein [Myxococcales bacterium]
MSQDNSLKKPSSKTQATAKETADDLNAVLQQLPQPTFTTDGGGRITWWNDAIEAVTGVSRREAVGKKVWSAFCPTRTVTPVDQAILMGGAHEVNFPVTHAGRGDTRDFTWRVHPQVEGDDVTSTVVTLSEEQASSSNMLSDSSPKPMLVCDKELIITYANPASIEMLRTIEEHLPIRTNELVGQSIDFFYQRHLIANPKNLPHTARIQIGPIWMKLNIYGLYDTAGVYQGPALTWEDITEEVAREEEREQLTNQLDALYRNQAVIEFEPDGTIVTANDNFLSVLGYTLEEIQGRHHRMFVEPEHTNSAAYQTFWRELGAGRTKADLFKRVGRGGREIWIQASYNPVTNSSGEVTRVIKFALDMTEKVLAERAAEAEHKANMARMRSLIENSPLGVMTCDIHDEFRINYANPAVFNVLNTFRDHLPIRPDEVVGKSIDIFHKRPEHQRRLLSDPANLPCETRLTMGDEVVALTVYALYDDSGKYTGPAVAWELVTEEARQEKRDQALKRSVARLQESLQALSHGDLNAHIDEAFTEEMEQTRQDVNNIVSVLQRFMRGFQELTRSHQNGRLSERASTQGLEGGFADLMSQVNDMLDAILQPVRELQGSLSSLSDGDLTRLITTTYQNDHALLTEAYNVSVKSLGGVIGEVRGSVGQISTASQEISSASQQVSEGASAQAAAIEEISAQMTDLTNKTRRNADDAGKANVLVEQAHSHASRGDVEMQKMLSAMNDINDASENISNIIKVIDDIAFQTNLLALNAAVEAARAGVHGKGFAVVAEEVRNLAARSAKAAKETTDLIKGSTQKVHQGTSIAHNTAEALSAIVESVTEVSSLIGRIADASGEQAEGIGQVHLGLEQINQVTQSNTAGAEQGAAAARQLFEQVGTLKRKLEHFKLIEKGQLNGHELPSWLTPEMFAMLQQMTGQQPGAAPVAPPSPPASFHGRPNGHSAGTTHWEAQSFPSNGHASSSSSPNGVDARHIIDLDDHEFGKY